MLREGSGEPLFLYHGIVQSGAVWRHVVPRLTDSFEVFCPTALGHRGGPEPSSRPATIPDVIDDAERRLDELGIEKAHLAGNSLGGWTALELARRGRALSVCALSPAGLWEEDWDEEGRVAGILRSALREAPRARRVLPRLARSARFRGWALREVANHGDRVTREDFLSGTDDTIGCVIGEDLLAPGFRLPPLEADCPITIAWSSGDRFFPLEVFRPRAEDLVPAAEFLVLEDVGHVPEMDDPGLVAETILNATRRAASLSSPGS